jgi:hypothetical protein
MTRITYVIRSHNRLARLREQSLALLQSWGIPKKDIYVFVADAGEVREYSGVLRPLGYHHIIAGKIGNVGSMEAIIDYFPVGTHILMMDDDVKKLSTCRDVSGKLKNKDLTGKKCVGYVEKGFDILKQSKMQIFGFYPIPNCKFMMHHPAITKSLAFIAGPIYGFINDRDVMQPRAKLKIDYERSLRSYLKYHGVVRFNHVSISTKYYDVKTEGGLTKERGKNAKEIREKEKIAAHFLKTEFPHLVHFKNVMKGTGFRVVIKDYGWGEEEGRRRWENAKKAKKAAMKENKVKSKRLLKKRVLA